MATRHLILLAVLVACVSSAATAQSPSAAESEIAAEPTAIFEDVAERTGLVFQHYNGMTGQLYLPEIVGSGAALFDYDNDGDLDVFLVQGNVLEPDTKAGSTRFPWQGSESPRGRLFRNDLSITSDGNRRLRFTDVTAQSGIFADGYGMGVAVGDLDNDGWDDLYLTNLGSNQTYRNNGDGTFTDITKQSGSDDPRWSTSAAFLDYDRDGWLDLVVVNYAEFSVTDSPACYAPTSAKDYCGPKAFISPGNSLFRNNGDGTFADATVAAGIDKEFGHGLGVVTADFDADGWIDMYFANDGDQNQLWMNQKNGRFQNDGLLAGAAVNRDGQAEAGMGVDAGDFDGNGTEDIFVTHLMDETHTLYSNLGAAMFDDRTREAGLGMPGHRFTGFGTLLFDYDNDGWLDLLIANGAVQLLPDLMRSGDPYPLGQPNQLFRNDGRGKFINVSDRAGEVFSRLDVSRGAAFGDLDNDGDVDVLIANNNGPANLLLNRIGKNNHWLGLRLKRKDDRHNALGARIEVVVSGKRSLWRRARTDGGYLSANDPRVLVGLGNSAKISAVRVRWPGGATEEWKALPTGRYITLTEGTGTLKK